MAMMNKYRKYIPARAVTLMELLVVVLIISILATIATGVYTDEVKRAKVAATQSLIHQLDVAITAYEVDTGSYPPSGSGDVLQPVPLDGTNSGTRRDGSGYLHLALMYSLSGSTNNPLSPLWRGPYINLQPVNVRYSTAILIGQMDILDAWQSPIIYVEHKDYPFFGAANGFTAGTHLFAGARPAGANPNLPAPNPFVALGETYYNSSTYQLNSFGPDGKTLGGGATNNYRGTAIDDIHNFGS